MRKPAAVLIGPLVAMLCIGAVANAAGVIPTTSMSASVSPRHALKAPYTFTTSGAIHYRRCPHGVTKKNYCSSIPPGHQTCPGTVSLAVMLGPDPILADAGTTVLTTSGKTSDKCTYSITVTIPKADLTATVRYRPHQRGSYVYVSFLARFHGNSVLTAKSARQQNVVAKLTKP